MDIPSSTQSPSTLDVFFTCATCYIVGMALGTLIHELMND